ncbi:putative MFS family arabinose efflux permease [Paraburkholderia sp. BL27I4N3]|uniref:MFS transporter n=1 Tax=Paraburkholderia sp. BL27I4N3 TaxID=1938805 RepID=UPI000E258BD3|nr:MFS transporter [Paraburkholderia sp. BL27I4N3]REE07366.1 putative MFS family arabinose efflux permease [Paraburkholderia sp. BL27I4N3]
MSQQSTVAEQALSPASSRRTASFSDVIAVVAGNALEFYDFTVYAFFAVFIGKAFFPAFSATSQVIASVAVFGVGFVARPIGGIVIGAYADRAGRKAALSLTIGLMALGTAIIAFTPTYGSIGMAAPLLVVAGRLLQGLSAGGEMGPATTYLLEVATDQRRGFYTSWQMATQGLAALLGGLVGYVVSSTLSADALSSWGWRLPFVLGLLIAPVGLYIRRRLHETLDADTAVKGTGELMSAIFRGHRSDLLLSCCVLIGPTVTVYVVGHYMTTYGMRVLHLPTSTSMLVGLMTGSVGLVAPLAAGMIYDRRPGTRMMVVPQCLSVLSIVPLFAWVITAGTGTLFLTMVAVLTLFRVLMAPFHLCFVPEIFPKAIRSTCISICYSVPTTLFGGSAQLVVAWLGSVTQDPMAPAWYLLTTNIVSLGAVLLLFFRHRRKVAPARMIATDSRLQDKPAT